MTLTATCLASYRRFLEGFIPPGIAANRESANRARMFLISHTIGPLLGNTVPAALYLLDSTPGPDIALLSLSISAFWVFPTLLRRGLPYNALVGISVANLNFCILLSLYFNGGVSSPTAPWLLIIPILALFYIGGDPALRFRLLSLSSAAFGLFFVTYLIFRPAPNDLPAYAMHGLGIVSTLAALAYVATMAIYYGRIFDASRELEGEIMRRRRISEELRAAVTQIEAAARARSDFLARMSHELRTPLNAVIGYGQILLEDAQDDGDTGTQKDMEKILDAAQYLLRLINMILDLSKIQAGRMTFYHQPIDLVDFFAEVLDGHAKATASNSNQMVLQLDPTLASVVSDRQRLTQIIDAIIENALQHTNNGTVTVSVNADPFFFHISVNDTGKGIAQDLLPNLFETFDVERDAADGRYGGTGVNLTLVDSLCRALGGSIRAESRLGEGSTFKVTLPRDGCAILLAAGQRLAA